MSGLADPSFHFDFIKVEGYRGRNLELTMNPAGSHTVFIMNNNTGKTTIIDLLRWCFSTKQSDAHKKFSHMWADYTHVLDSRRSGKQTCKILVGFTADGRKYRFSRTTIGEHVHQVINTEGRKQLLVGQDSISQVYDTLDIDGGRETRQNDEVFEYLNNKFRLSHSADFFCFDGEKASEIMKSSTSTVTINNLIQSVNRRASHPKIKRYQETLDQLRDRVFSLARKEGAGRATDTTIERRMAELERWGDERKEKDAEIRDLEENQTIYQEKIRVLSEEIKQLDNQITEAKSRSLFERRSLEEDLRNAKQEIEGVRRDLYGDMRYWVHQGVGDRVTTIKKQVKEIGKLPEPFHTELIKACLESEPPTCQICGRELDNVCILRVQELEKSIATSEVYAFLSDLEPDEFPFIDFANDRKRILELLENIDNITEDIQNLDLSDEDKEIYERRSALIEEKEGLLITTGNLAGEIQAAREIVKEIKAKIQAEERNIGILSKYTGFLEEIEATKGLLEEAQRKIENRTINIISTVISSSISSVLGDEYSAILDKNEGLLLAQGNIAGKDLGGMAARMILSYCFAEAMSTIDPLIVDTPSGNIDEINREKLAEHLAANHKQVILFCLRNEVLGFGDKLSTQAIEITNRDYKYAESMDLEIRKKAGVAERSEVAA